MISTPYKRGVTGSNPVPPTCENKPRSDHAAGLRAISVPDRRRTGAPGRTRRSIDSVETRRGTVSSARRRRARRRHPRNDGPSRPHRPQEGRRHVPVSRRSAALSSALLHVDSPCTSGGTWRPVRPVTGWFDPIQGWPRGRRARRARHRPGRSGGAEAGGGVVRGSPRDDRGRPGACSPPSMPGSTGTAWRPRRKGCSRRGPGSTSSEPSPWGSHSTTGRYGLGGAGGSSAVSGQGGDPRPCAEAGPPWAPRAVRCGAR
jgi:hypothetical protein